MRICWGSTAETKQVRLLDFDFASHTSETFILDIPIGGKGPEVASALLRPLFPTDISKEATFVRHATMDTRALACKQPCIGKVAWPAPIFFPTDYYRLVVSLCNVSLLESAVSRQLERRTAPTASPDLPLTCSGFSPCLLRATSVYRQLERRM